MNAAIPFAILLYSCVMGGIAVWYLWKSPDERQSRQSFYYNYGAFFFYSILSAIGIEKRDTLKKELDQLAARKQHVASELEQLQSQLVNLSDALMLQEVGIYQYSHPLENSVEYKGLLDKIDEQTKALIKSNKAVTAVASWTVNGSEKEGQKMVKESN